ncbi:hypothetical protein F441_06849 [Phytophthora nicotianae CJ01A1]|uniref:Uncharacterized protein n=5 Tax=Phytophthora nicotianae TaxID=4792 RepID=W2RF99_PHYN3|nr:hypothetical protein PPTG_20990 [Phytophthora nicotianae INRA-310]ETI49250.1 hypothetical protein F443_06846 [Phytophthora nicotianae P1569]ETO77983.1 hypothetical protein F444_06913 [Phytophthora nicotianae P1976]ETP19016.1 hypothetical protein F441_06849 [Phytophthora nicotianae CJ01A1]ETP46962.1 hypothetical protein F442_06885 [Phytophthora nicotianae P10297]ETN23329.1 hypothetical protein PPTG_20990 [Phytophthora nicotianae INRA-310]
MSQPTYRLAESNHNPDDEDGNCFVPTGSRAWVAAAS